MSFAPYACLSCTPNWRYVKPQNHRYIWYHWIIATIGFEWWDASFRSFERLVRR